MTKIDIAALRGLRLLVVEDEAFLAMSLEDILTDLGCIVVGLAGNVPAALSLARSLGSRMDGAVLDVNIAGERVFPVADALTEAGVPFVFATGYGREGIEPRFAGSPTLAKPYRAAALAEALCEAMLPHTA